MNPIGIQGSRQSKQVAPANPAGVAAEVRIDGQGSRVIRQEWVKFLAEPSSPSDVRGRFHEGHIRWHGRMIRAAEFGNQRSDRGVLVTVAAQTRLGVEVGGLKDAVWLMVAVAGVDRADNREVVEQGGLFRQMLADPDSRQPGRNCIERAAILWRSF